MLTDEWLILAYIMIFTSVILCGFLPMTFRLVNARRRFHRYDLERQAIEYSCPHAFLTSESIYSDVQLDISDLHNDTHLDFQRTNSNEQSITPVTELPFIDDSPV
ncbi:unnamed protein product [Adineta steineri]|uniref:Uncharacterized protein n=1 Tax=Adineta steineri TaxID=433720 RepID=A0A815NVA9_9BILA|nr:unnamed protein product [Adineta steineri]